MFNEPISFIYYFLLILWLGPFKGIYDSYECEVCNKEEETQEHILNCKEINKVNEVENNEKIIE